MSNESALNSNKADDLANKPIFRLLFQLSLPAIAAQIINVLYNVVDRMYIGHIPNIGASALTGIGVTMPVIIAVSAFAYLVSMGGSPRASIMMENSIMIKQRKYSETVL